MRKAAAIAFVAFLAVILAVPTVWTETADAESSTTDTSSPLEVTYTLKGVTTTVTFDGPTDKVVVFGTAATRTVFDVGCADKIYGTDKYGMKALSDAGANVTPVSLPFEYSGNSNDSIFNTLLKAVEDGEFSKDDAVIITTFTSAANDLKNRLVDEAGFTHVVFYGSIYTYEDMATCIEQITYIVGGDTAPAQRIRDVANSITSKLNESGESDTDAIFLRHSASNGWGYGVSGSLAISIMEAAGGKNIGTGEGKTATIYDSNKIIRLLSDNPQAVILMDNAYLDSNGGSMQTFIDEYLGGDLREHKILVLDALWNNYDPEYADGLEAVASVLHPDLFTYDGEMRYYGPSDVEDDDDDSTTYILAAVIAVIVIAAIAGFAVYRSRSRKVRSGRQGSIMGLGRRARVAAACTVLTAVFAASVLLDLAWSNELMPASDLTDVLLGKGGWADTLIVKHNARRVAIGALVGAGLAASGAAMQAIFRNPMASPYILGLSSGASLGAAVGILFSIPFIPMAVSTPLLAFVMCLLTMFLVYGISRVGGQTHVETLLLTGIAVSSMMTAIVSFLTFIAGDELEDIVFWSMGSLTRATVEEISVAAPLIALGCIALCGFSKDMNAMMLGDAHAMDLGVDVGRTRLILLVSTSLVTASAVAFVGTIGFVGLIIPHIFRIIVGPDNRVLIPVSMLGGATFLVLCDFLAHSIAPEYGVLPVGILTSLIGAPYFVFLLRRRRREIGWNRSTTRRTSASDTATKRSLTGRPWRS